MMAIMITITTTATVMMSEVPFCVTDAFCCSIAAGWVIQNFEDLNESTVLRLILGICATPIAVPSGYLRLINLRRCTNRCIRRIRCKAGFEFVCDFNGNKLFKKRKH